MDSHLTLTTLPNEMLAKIFSNLTQKEVLMAARVCQKFQDLSYISSLWKSVEVDVKNEATLLSFCSFFNEVPFVRHVSVRFSHNRMLSGNEVNALRELFSNLKQLYSLNVDNLVSFKDVFLPPSLKHLYGYYFDPNFKESGTVFEFLFVDKCQNIEHLYLLERVNSSNIANKSFLKFGEHLLKKYASSLKTSYLLPFKEEWMPLVASCFNLRKLHVNFGKSRTPTLHYLDLVGLSRLPHLEVLVVESHFWKHFLPVLNKYRLPKVNHLAVIGGLLMDRKDFDAVLENVPKLEILCIWGVRNLSDLLDFIEKCHTIKYLSFNCIDVHVDVTLKFFKEIFRLHQKRPFQGICFCQELTAWMALNLEVELPENFKKCSSFAAKKCSDNYFGIKNGCSWYRPMERLNNTSALDEYIDRNIRTNNN